MATANNRRIRRVAAAGALAVAALTGPALAALGFSSAATDSAQGKCLAWYGSMGDGICLGYSNGTPTYIGTPQGGYLGPGYGVGIPGAGSNGIGITSGPLLPGQTINTPIGGH